MKNFTQIKESQNLFEKIDLDNVLIAVFLAESDFKDEFSQQNIKEENTTQEFLTKVQHIFINNPLIKVAQSNLSHDEKELNWQLTDKNWTNFPSFNLLRNYNRVKYALKKAKEIENHFKEIKDIIIIDQGLIVNNIPLLNLRRSSSKLSKISQHFFGIEDNEIYNNQLMNHLIKKWIQILFRYMNECGRDVLENFLFDTQINEVDNNNYFKWKINVEEMQHIGFYLPFYNKYYKYLSDFCRDVSLDSQFFNDYNRFSNEWNYLKNEILNKKIILPLIKEKLNNNYIDELFKRLIIEEKGLKDFEYINIKDMQAKEEKDEILNSQLNLKYDYWVDKSNNFVIRITSDFNFYILIKIGWNCFAPASKVGYKIKFNYY